jgi:hypothetical protein
MGSSKYVTLSGRDLYVIMGVESIYLNVPFKQIKKRPLSAEELRTLEDVVRRAVDAREMICDRPPEERTLDSRKRVMRELLEFMFLPQEARLLSEILSLILSDFESDYEIGPFAGTFIRRQDYEDLRLRLDEQFR